MWGQGKFDYFLVLQFMDFIFSQEAETNAKVMELEIGKLQKKLEEKNEQLQVSTSSAEKVSISYTVPYYYSFHGL